VPPPQQQYYSPPPAPYSPPPPPYPQQAAPPPPSYPAAVAQPSYPPATGYPAQPQWTGPPPLRREGLAGWVLVALGTGVGVAAIVALAAILASFGPDLDGTARALWLAAGIAGAVALALSLCALLGLRARDRWGPLAGWGSVAALTLTVLGVPVAAAVGWGIAQTPAGSLVAPQSRPGGGVRAGAPLVGGALVLLLVLGTSIVGFGQQGAGTPTAQVTPTPTACNILKAGTPMSKTAIGLDCGFTAASTVAQVDCRGVTSLPGPLESLSYDDTTNTIGGNSTFTMDSAGCHLLSPTKGIESDIASTAALGAGPTVMVADFLVPQTAALMGFLFACDSPDQLAKCMEVDLDTTDSSIYVYDDDNQLIGQTVATLIGPNRLMAVFQGQGIRVWFNGRLVATETAKRVHSAGRYLLWAENIDDKNPLEAIVQQFAVYSLTR
jgi:hypothetical protein